MSWPGWVKREVLYGAELAALAGFAFVQPLLDVMGRAPDYFLFRAAGRREILLFVVAIVVVPLATLCGVGLVTRLAGGRVRRGAHRAAVAALLLLVAVHATKIITPWRGVALGVAAVVVAAAVWAAYLRLSPVASWFRFLSPAPVVFALLFLLFSPVSVLVTGGDTAEGLAGVEARAPVVLIVFDEFPLMTLLNKEGEIDERLYPNFAALANDSDWFRNATAVSGHTPIAMPAIMTGRYPDEEFPPPHLAHYPHNIFTLLGGSYRVQAVEAVTQLCPTNVCTDSPDPARMGGVRLLLADAVRTWRSAVWLHDTREDPAAQVGVDEAAESPTDAMTESVARDANGGPRTQLDLGEDFAALPLPGSVRGFLESIDGRERTFSYLHVLLPHVPWRHLPSGVPFGDAAVSRYAGPNIHDEEWPYVVDRHRHLLQTMYTDAVMGAVVEHLRDVGIYDRSLLVVTADHGLNFLPGRTESRKRLNEGNAAQLMWVPLFVKTPGQADGRTVDDNAMVIDILPTVADVIGVDVPWPVDGIPLLDERRATPVKHFWSPGKGKDEIDARDWFPLVRQGVTDQLVRPEEGDVGLYRVGRWGHLVGTSPTDHVVEPVGSATAQIAQRQDFADVDPSDHVPALATGFIGSGPDGIDGIAVVVNGTIAGVSEVFPLAGRDRGFATMLWPAVFREGANEVDLYALSDTSDGVVLTPARRQ